MKLVVTGASGFVGRALVAQLQEAHGDLVAVVRRPGSAPAGSHEVVTPDILDSSGTWERVLEGADTVFHLAGLAHVPISRNADELQRVNVHGAAALAAAAGSAGVRRIVFLSSAKVSGERSGRAGFREEDPPRPEDEYGRSKWEGEQALRAAAAGTQLEVTVVRAPLVYGPGVKANFLKLMRWVERGVPLPFATVHNRRSLIFVGNLVDALVRCADPLAAGEVYHVSDQDDLSTPELIRRIAEAMRVRPRLIPAPPSLLWVAAKIVRREAVAGRLLDSLVLDATKISRHLGWTPPWSVSAGLAQTTAWYLGRHAGAHPNGVSPSIA